MNRSMRYLAGKTDASPHPMEVMRQTFRAMGIPFQEDDGTIFTRLALENIEVHVIAWGYPDDLAKVIVRIPVRAAKKFRAEAGELLHRLNCNARRKYWELSYDDGEIRLSCFTDTLVGPLTERLFRALLNALVSAADAAFPYIAGVLSGRMSAELAADQAEAAVQSGWEKKA